MGKGMRWSIYLFLIILFAFSVNAVTLTDQSPIYDITFDSDNPNINYDTTNSVGGNITLSIGGLAGSNRNSTLIYIYNVATIPLTDRITDCKLDISFAKNISGAHEFFLGNFSTNNSLNNGTGNETMATWNWYNSSLFGYAIGAQSVYTNVTNRTSSLNAAFGDTLSFNCTTSANKQLLDGTGVPNMTFVIWSNSTQTLANAFPERRWNIGGTNQILPRLNITSAAAISLSSASLNVTNSTLTATADFINASVTIGDLATNKANLTLTFYVNNVANQTIQITNDLLNGGFSYVFNNTNVSRTQTIVIQFNGTNGASASDYINTSIITVGNSIPSRPTITIPLNDTYVTTRNLTISWNNATDADPQAISCNLDISTNSGFTGIIHSASDLAQGVQPTRYNVTIDLNRTSYWLRNRCSDTLDNGTYDYSNFTIDSVVPNVSIGSPNATFTSQSTIPLNWTIRDDGSLGSCFYNITRTNGIIEIADTAINCTGTTNLTFNVALNADFIANVRANDTAGNLNLTNTTFTVSEVDGGIIGGGGGGGSQSPASKELNESCSSDNECKSGLCDLLGRKVCILQGGLCGNNICDKERGEGFDSGLICPSDCGFANNFNATIRLAGAKKEIVIILGSIVLGILILANTKKLGWIMKRLKKKRSSADAN